MSYLAIIGAVVLARWLRASYLALFFDRSGNSGGYGHYEDNPRIVGPDDRAREP